MLRSKSSGSSGSSSGGPSKHGGASSSSKSHRSQSATSAGGAEQAANNATTGIPILIVPTAVTSTITGANVVPFLQHSRYEPVDVQGASAAPSAGNIHDQLIRVPLVLMGQQVLVPIRVVDNPTNLTPHEWDRVIAVFATGQAWQFKKWKWEQPVELFQHVLGRMLVSPTANPNMSVAVYPRRSFDV